MEARLAPAEFRIEDHGTFVLHLDGRGLDMTAPENAPIDAIARSIARVPAAGNKEHLLAVGVFESSRPDWAESPRCSAVPPVGLPAAAALG